MRPFSTEAKAQAYSALVRKIIGDEWFPCVWENLGWNVSWQWGSVTLYFEPRRDQYHCLVGEPDGCGGHIDLSQEGGWSSDPKKAIRLACDEALEVFENGWKPIMSSVAQVRLSV